MAAEGEVEYLLYRVKPSLSISKLLTVPRHNDAVSVPVPFHSVCLDDNNLGVGI